jgi:hypothetical protein
MRRKEQNGKERLPRQISNGHLRGRETVPEYSFGGEIGVLLYGMMGLNELDNAIVLVRMQSLTRFVA